MEDLYSGDIQYVTGVDLVAKYAGRKARHPLIDVIDFSRIMANPPKRVYYVYTLFLMNYTMPKWTYGKSENNILCSSVVAMAPGQMTEPTRVPYEKNVGIGLFFHPDLIHGTALGSLIHTYKFLHYNFNQSLFLNDRIRNKYLHMLNQLQDDLDTYGESLNIIYITKLLEKILDLLMEAYRPMADLYRTKTGDVLCELEYNCREYLMDHCGKDHTLPQVSYFAGKVGLTSSHFGETVKELLGITARKYISLFMAEFAKEWLLHMGTAREVGRCLGFSDTPHFTRFFTNTMGYTPTQYLYKRRQDLADARTAFAESDDLKLRLANAEAEIKQQESIY